jgi:hypothetical protein
MDMHEPYDWDKYAGTFFPSAAMLVTKAQEAESSGDRKLASDLYLWAANDRFISKDNVLN